jgi:hypothetical protein
VSPVKEELGSDGRDGGRLAAAAYGIEMGPRQPLTTERGGKRGTVNEDLLIYCTKIVPRLYSMQCLNLQCTISLAINNNFFSE